MSPKKKKSSKKGKIILVFLVILFAGFTIWTYPSTQVQSFDVTTLLGSQSYSFNVKILHNVLILDISYSGYGGAISFSLINPQNVYIYNYTKLGFDGTYTLHYKITNATDGTWPVKIVVVGGTAKGNITITTMGIPWNYIFT